jgi:hypothetical protein
MHIEEVENELINEKIEKYEYWIDPPFRTIRPNVIVVKNNEKEFLDFIYSIEEE